MGFYAKMFVNFQKKINKELKIHTPFFRIGAKKNNNKRSESLSKIIITFSQKTVEFSLKYGKILIIRFIKYVHVLN